MSEQVIGFHYTLKDAYGNLIDTSDQQPPLLFLVGSGHIIPGLETVLVSMNIGDKKNVVVPAADAYGEIVAELQLTVKKDQFPEDATLTVGDQFQVTNEEHAPVFTIIEIEGDEVHIDGNHPMAGRELHFDVEITEKREATEEELAHGHAHGEGGHQH